MAKYDGSLLSFIVFLRDRYTHWSDTHDFIRQNVFKTEYRDAKSIFCFAQTNFPNLLHAIILLYSGATGPEEQVNKAFSLTNKKLNLGYYSGSGLLLEFLQPVLHDCFGITLLEIDEILKKAGIIKYLNDNITLYAEYDRLRSYLENIERSLFESNKRGDFTLIPG